MTTAVYSSGPGDAVDVEEPVLAEEAQRDPHPGGLDQQLGAQGFLELGVPAGPDVPVGREGDRGGDVELRRAGRVVGAGLESVDGAPGEEGAVDAEFLGADLGLGQEVVAEFQDLAGVARVGVGQVGQQVHLLVPEVVAVVAGAGHALGRDAGHIGAGRGLRELEEVPADALLELGLARQHDVARAPVVAVVVLALGEDLADRLEAGFGVVGEVLGGLAHGVADALLQHERCVRADGEHVADAAVVLVHLGVERLHAGRGPVVHGHPEPLLGFRGFPGQAQGAVAAVEPQGQQHAPGVPAGAARIMGGVVLHRLVLAVDDRGRDVRGDIPVRGHFQADAQRAAGFVADGAAFGGGHGGAGAALPGDPALVDAGGEVHRAAVVQHGGLVQAQRFAVDDDGEVVGVRDVEDPLAGAGEAVGVFRVLDVPGLVEAVDEAAGKFGVRGAPSARRGCPGARCRG